MSSPRNPSVIVIGAGMTGILMVIKLREAGITDITLIEKKSSYGGTWRENTYPGVACDVPSHMYTYSFERNPNWNHRFSNGAEIRQYFERVANKYGVIDKTRFNEEVVAANYRKGKWTVHTNKNETLTADFLVCATGILHQPAIPKFKQQDEFAGHVFHSSQWDHKVDLTGKRVGIVGNGSTAVQIISSIYDKVDHLTIFQRTPQWIVTVPNRKFSDTEKNKFRNNGSRIEALNRIYSLVFDHVFSAGVTGKKVPHAILSMAAKASLRKVKDPTLRKKLTPDYKVGCKRLVGSEKFYEAVQHPNVTLETSSIDRYTKSGITTEAGSTHDLDVVILSTGFDPAAYMRPMELLGKNGVSINETWNKKIKAYRSMFIPGYPNFFLMLGPNSPIGNVNVIHLSEVQSDYVVKMVNQWRMNNIDEIDVKEEACERFNQGLKAGMKDTIWVSGGCQSWYLDSDGDPLTWPYSSKRWRQEMETPNLEDFHVTAFAKEDSSLIQKESNLERKAANS